MNQELSSINYGADIVGPLYKPFLCLFVKNQ